MTTDTAAAWPRIEATIHDDGTGEVTIGGSTQQVQAEDLPAARDQVRQLAADTARKLGRPVRAVMTDPDGQWPLIVKTDGTLEADETAEARPRPRTKTPARTAVEPAKPRPRPEPQTPPAEAPSPEKPVSATSEAAERSESNGTAAHGWVRSAEEQAATAAGTTYTRREQRQSFLTREQVEEPATQGWRGLLTRAGVRMSPSPTERAERADIQAVSQHWPGPRTIAIVNGKGGAGKTPSTVLLAAVFARYGGASVLAWDNNQTRGTLGWRTAQGPHEATITDLLPHVDELLGVNANSADLARFVHHQPGDLFDVLRSKPSELRWDQRLTMRDLDNIHAVATKYYRLIVMDSGNDESDVLWLTMLDHTDQLVVVTTTREDHAEAGALLLESLNQRERTTGLASNAVVIVTQADPQAKPAEVQRIVEGFQPLARAVATIPFDPGMVDGILRYGSLRPATQRAWLAAGAAVARGL